MISGFLWLINLSQVKFVKTLYTRKIAPFLHSLLITGQIPFVKQHICFQNELNKCAVTRAWIYCTACTIIYAVFTKLPRWHQFRLKLSVACWGPEQHLGYSNITSPLVRVLSASCYWSSFLDWKCCPKYHVLFNPVEHCYLTIIRRRRSEYCRIIPETKSRGLFDNIHWAWGE